MQAASLRQKFFPAGMVSEHLFAGAISLGVCQQCCKTKKDLECKQLAVGSCRNSTGNPIYGAKQGGNNSFEKRNMENRKRKFKAVWILVPFILVQLGAVIADRVLLALSGTPDNFQQVLV